MTDLQKIIEKANLKEWKGEEIMEIKAIKYDRIFLMLRKKNPSPCEDRAYTGYVELEQFIFDHGFLKTYFKNETEEPRFLDLHDWMLWDEETPSYVGEIWQYHAQQLALSTDRIEYLMKYLGQEEQKECKDVPSD